MKILKIIFLSLIILLCNTAVATNGTASTNGPIGKAVSVALKPMIKKSVMTLVKNKILSKTTGKVLSKKLIKCTTVEGLYAMTKEQLTFENCATLASSGGNLMYEKVLMPNEISLEVKNNMQDYYKKHKGKRLQR